MDASEILLTNIHQSFAQIFSAARSSSSPLHVEETRTRDSHTETIILLPEYARIADPETTHYGLVIATLERYFKQNCELVSEQFVRDKQQPRGLYSGCQDKTVLESNNLLRTVMPTRTVRPKRYRPKPPVTKAGYEICNENYTRNFAVRMQALAQVVIGVSA